MDLHSKALNPMFVNPENAYFRLKADSPALEMGVVTLDLSKMGLDKEKEAVIIILFLAKMLQNK